MKIHRGDIEEGVQQAGTLEQSGIAWNGKPCKQLPLDCEVPKLWSLIFCRANGKNSTSPGTSEGCEWFGFLLSSALCCGRNGPKLSFLAEFYLSYPISSAVEPPRDRAHWPCPCLTSEGNCSCLPSCPHCAWLTQLQTKVKYFTKAH